MDLKIKDFLPPIIYHFLIRAYYRAQGAGWHVCTGCYPTLADVPSSPDLMNTDWFAEAVVERIGSLKFEMSHDPVGHAAHALVLPLLVSTLIDQRLMVLDFAGGVIRGLKHIIEHVPNVDLTRLHYILVETPAVCRGVRGLLDRLQEKRFDSIEVLEEIPASLPSPLIVHASGAILYIPDYHGALSRLLALAPDIFILANTPVTDAPTFAQAQHNNPGHIVGRWVFNRKALISEIEQAGYRLVCTFDQNVPVTHKNSKPSNDVSMVFLPQPTLHSTG